MEQEMEQEMEQVKVKFYKPSLKHQVKRQFKKFKRYCYVSLISASMLFILLFVFTSLLHMYYLLSFIMASLISVTLNFTLNKIYIFNIFNPKRLIRQYWQFLIVSFSAFIANLIALYVLVEFFGLWYLLAQLFIGVVGLPLLFTIHRIIVFSHPRN